VTPRVPGAPRRTRAPIRELLSPRAAIVVRCLRAIRWRVRQRVRRRVYQLVCQSNSRSKAQLRRRSAIISERLTRLTTRPLRSAIVPRESVPRFSSLSCVTRKKKKRNERRETRPGFVMSPVTAFETLRFISNEPSSYGDVRNLAYHNVLINEATLSRESFSITTFESKARRLSSLFAACFPRARWLSAGIRYQSRPRDFRN